MRNTILDIKMKGFLIVFSLFFTGGVMAEDMVKFDTFETITRKQALEIAKKRIQSYNYFKNEVANIELMNEKLHYQYKISFPWVKGMGGMFEYIHVFIDAKTGKVLKIMEDPN